MYGNGSVAGGATALAMTGLAAGSWVLAAVGIICAGAILIALVRKNSKVRP